MHAPERCGLPPNRRSQVLCLRFRSGTQSALGLDCLRSVHCFVTNHGKLGRRGRRRRRRHRGEARLVSVRLTTIA